MKATYKHQKWFWTKHPWTTSLWVLFDYADVAEINKLPEVFKIYLTNWEEVLEYNASANKEAARTIDITTISKDESYKSNPWKINENIEDVREASFKIDVYIDDLVSGMLRVFDIYINEDPSHAQFWQLD